ncbi:MAG: DUF4386 domain-containing protein [Anaerolineales bacterium]|nr:DUF4386 domain-containing protein [Anaerolineales bacterium]
MATQSLQQTANDSPADARSSAELRARRAYSAVIGGLFISAFFLYGIGYGLVTSVTGAPAYLVTIAAHQLTLTTGSFLMLLNSVVVVGLGVLFFPILAQHGQRTAQAYLAARLVEGIFLASGVLALLMLLPLGQFSVDAGEASRGWATVVGSLLTQANTMAYQIAMLSLGFASLFMCTLLLRTRLVPGFLAVWGFVGYAIFMTGAIAEIFGLPVGVMLSVPGGLFELSVGLWLIIKGFQPAADSQAA